MPRRIVPLTLALAALAALSPNAGHAQGDVAPRVPGLFSALPLRSIGPAVTGGRIHDVEALPEDPATIYVGTASGGLWKTVNKGTTWTPLFDDQPVSTFGDIAISRSHPDVLWVGTGEQNNRQSTSYGNGVYRSTDAGRTWTHLGLEQTRHIGRVQVHPTDPDVAYVAAAGNLWAASEARGVYKTVDGGRTWEKVLFVDTLTGVNDLQMDPSNPDVLYAAAYQRMRRAWGFNGGGPGSGIFKTTDGGRTWQRLSNGLPEAPIGRIGLAVAPSEPRVVYARVEHPSAGGVYRSDDAGASWTRMNELNPRPMYYSKIFVDPTDPRRVYVISEEAFVSEDGGRTFRELPTRPTYDVGVHSDHHALWIDPSDPSHFYLAGDGGFHETWDYGETYEKINNFSIAQIYALGVDRETPYNVYIGLQDNHSWMGPSATRHWIGILNDDWRQIGFGDGMYHQVADLRNVFSTAQNGSLQRVDAVTGDRLEVYPRPEPGSDEEYRFDWVTPILVSRHDPSTVYYGGNRLFISRDLGATWERTADLTKAIDRDTLRIMGVLGSERTISRNDGTASFGEIVTIDESPLDGDILWVGTDDGNIQVSRDGGATWTEVARNIRGRPAPTTYVSRVSASPAAPGVAYAALDAHRDGDFGAYLYKTEDFGSTWTRITEGLAPVGPVNDVVVHPDNPDLLFAGTEHAVYVSTDAGARWQRFGVNLPTTLYDDLLIHPTTNDLVVGTHGRGVWILDDVAPLVEWSDAVAGAPVHVFSIRPATIFQYWKDTSYRGQAAYAGENPAEGAIVSYYLGGRGGERGRAGTALLRVTNDAGEVVREMRVPAEPGVIHRVNWDLRHGLPDDAAVADDDGDDVARGWGMLGGPPQPLGPRGPFVSPGRYRVTLEAPGGARASSSVLVQGDPLMPMLAEEDYQARERFMLDVLDVMRRLEALGGQDAEVRRLTRQARGLYFDLAGGGVRQGSLYPPTPPMRAELEFLRRRVGELSGGGR